MHRFAAALGRRAASTRRRGLAATLTAVVALLLMTIPMGSAVATPLSQERSAVSAEAATSRIFVDTNQVRASRGLGLLVRDPQLDAIAMAWTAQMASVGSLSHNPDLRRQLPGGWTAYGENVAAGYAYTNVVAGWSGSSGHLANMVGGYSHLGIGYAEVGGVPYYTQVFARYPAAPAPSTSGSARSFVTAAYADVLGRTPAASEADWWVGQLLRGMPRSSVASGFNDSDEYRLGRIRDAYRNVLGREAEPEGLSGWLGLMRIGWLQSDDADRVFLTTQEFYLSQGGGTDRGYIRALYRFVLGRESEPGGEDYWVQIVSSQGRDTVVRQIWMSDERLRLRAAEMYAGLLGRAASVSEQAAWSSFASVYGITSMRTAIMSSDEYYVRAARRFPV